jgi:predicted AlkP superfamily pyrophosphatase or phosphodiesterase
MGAEMRAENTGSGRRAVLAGICTATGLGFALCATPSPAQDPAAGGASPPRLILQITVDQLRGDLPERFAANYGTGGWRYLLDEGIWYANAHHGHANTETVVGHTTLATGADPAEHGMVANIWLDRQTGRLAYNIEDPAYSILTPGGSVDQATEVDPTQKVASTDGRSPNAILGTTFSDELAARTLGGAKIFGVSIKDRGAVTLAGHAGKAFWFSKSAGRFVTSTYYYDAYPAWVEAYTAANPVSVYANTSWDLLLDPSAYQFGAADDAPWETAFGTYGRTFPHPFGDASSPYFTTLLTLSPVGDEMTLNFAKALVEAEGLGQDAVTDYLAISFSSTDYVGHLFGPSSLEAEDNQLRLDRTLADLFAFVDGKIGLENVTIVLSADHGAAEAPGYLNALGIPAKLVNPLEWETAPGFEALKQKFGIGPDAIIAYQHPYVYLDHELVAASGADPAAVEAAVAEELMKLPGVALALSARAIAEGRIPDTALARTVLRNHNPARSGDVFVVFDQLGFINEFDGLVVTANHGSPWRYDSWVPVVFAGGGLQPDRVNRRIETIDVAPTLAAIAGTKAPSGSRSAPLAEVTGAMAD